MHHFLVLDSLVDAEHLLKMQRRDRDRVIKLGAEIDGLRRRLQEKESELDLLLKGEDPTSGARQAASPAPSNRAEIRGELTQGIVSLLRSAPGQAFTADEIVTNLGGSAAVQSVRSTLARLVKRGLIGRGKPGEYFYSPSPPDRWFDRLPSGDRDADAEVKSA